MSGNGIDLGHVTAMLQQVLSNQAEQGRTLAEHGRMLAELTRRVDAQSRVLDEHSRRHDAHDRRFDQQDQVLAEIAQRLDAHDRRFDQQGQLLIVMARKLEDLGGLQRDVATLRQEVALYHASVLGHGVLISELDERQRRVEQHLGLPPAA